MQDATTLKIYTDQIAKDFKTLELEIQKRKSGEEDLDLELTDHKTELTDSLQKIKNSV